MNLSTRSLVRPQTLGLCVCSVKQEIISDQSVIWRFRTIGSSLPVTFESSPIEVKQIRHHLYQFAPKSFSQFPLECIPFQSKSQHFVQRFEPEISRPSIGHFCTFSLTNAGCSNINLINPFTPKISLVILLTICHTILIVLVRRIWYWINK